MNVVNRIIVIVAAMALVVAVTAICLLPEISAGQLSILSDYVDQIVPSGSDVTGRLILIVVAAVIDVVLLLFLVLELRRPRAKAVSVQGVDGGSALVTVDSIRQRLAFYIDGLEDVVSVKPRVQIRRDRVSAAVDVVVSATVDLPAKAGEIVGIIRAQVTEAMGLKMAGEPKVKIRIGSYKDAPRVEPPVPPPLPSLVAPDLSFPADEEE